MQIRFWIKFKLPLRKTFVFSDVDWNGHLINMTRIQTHGFAWVHDYII